jgi:HlyD family secretion protein
MRLPPRRVLAVAAASLLALAAFLWMRRGAPARYASTVVDRADVAEVVGATGALEAVTTVQVGSQVSGTIQSLHADFNSVVRRGQVIARLDPSLFEARLGQSRANLMAARANAERARAAVADTRQKLQRARELSGQQLLPESDLETAQSNQDSAVAQVKAADATVRQAEAAVNQAEVDLAHTVIEAPIDGIVIARNVDVGQTVAASLQAPTLFVIANDLTRMRVNAAIDEADIGRVRVGQEVSFRVDAYPDRTFPAVVEQVRLQPTTVQNVVTYNTILAVENPDLRLMPGMTATVSVIVRRSPGALRIASAALRFRPAGFEAGPAERRPGGGPPGTAAPGRQAGAGESGVARAAAPPSAASPAATPAASPRRERPPGVSSSRGGPAGPEADRRGGGPDGRDRGRGGLPEGWASRRGAGGSAGGGWRGPRRPSGDGATTATAPPTSGGAALARTLEAEPDESRPALVFVLDERGQPAPRRIRVGISDGQFVEVKEGLEEGARVVTGLESEGNNRGGAPRAGPSPAANNPFQPQFGPQRRRQ